MKTAMFMTHLETMPHVIVQLILEYHDCIDIRMLIFTQVQKEGVLS
jgi:hypothetical protein